VAAGGAGGPEVGSFQAPLEDPGLVEILDVQQAAGGKVDLTEAAIIVTGGRPIASAENFKILDALAEPLGAAVGASRAAVDAGYAPHGMQVGQTGKTVSPKLYIACGLSGSVQHFAGMKTSKIIVAINTDKDAPIFEKCDYGIVGDLFEVVPVLTEKLKAG
jgi:electron transfer flavoprotein alpha subunit